MNAVNWTNRNIIRRQFALPWANMITGRWLINAESVCAPPGGGGVTPLYKLYMYVKPHRVGFLGRFGLESGVVFGGTTRVYERIYRFNLRKKEREICEFEMDLMNLFFCALI